MPAPILEIIGRTDKLPSLPSVATKVVQICQSPEVNMEEVYKVLQNDPTLMATIVRMVNSPLYGLARRVTSVKQAMMILGLNSIKVLALSFSVVPTLSRGEGFDHARFWRRSLTTAVAAHQLARDVDKLIADDAFVAGLLTDVGIWVAWRCAPELYRPVLAEWTTTKRPLAEIENERLSVTHAEMTFEVLKTWGLPEPICDVCKTHEGAGLEELPEHSLNLGRIVFTAAGLSAISCDGLDEQQMEEVKAACRSQLIMEDEQLQGVTEELDEHVHELADMLQVELA